MMRNITRATALLLLLSGNVMASEVSPEDFIRQLIEAFNSENLETYQSNFHYPYSRIYGDQIQIMKDETAPAVDFSLLRKTGWVRSDVNEVKVLDRGSNSAVVQLNFSRINAAGKAILTSNFFYTLVQSEDSWKVISWSIANTGPRTSAAK